jgi:hypothetical protein
MNNSYRTFFSSNFKKTFNNKNIFNVFNTNTNSQKSLTSFSNKYYMTKLNALMNTQNLNKNFSLLVTGLISPSEAAKETDIQEVLPLNGDLITSLYLVCKHGMYLLN